MLISRRAFLTLAAALGSALGSGPVGFAAAKRKPRILLRSSWQTVNIGDIAHTPGVLALLERHLPAAEVSLWPSHLDNGVEVSLRHREVRRGRAHRSASSCGRRARPSDRIRTRAGASV